MGAECKSCALFTDIPSGSILVNALAVVENLETWTDEFTLKRIKVYE